MRCSYLDRKDDVPMADFKLHSIYICRNKDSEKYEQYSVDKCHICSNCLAHQKIERRG